MLKEIALFDCSGMLFRTFTTHNNVIDLGSRGGKAKGLILMNVKIR